MRRNGRLHSAFAELPLGAIEPRGWLLEQLRIQANGLTGALEEHWESVGPQSGWLGGTGESWERGPYYVDGLIPLAYLLQDQGLIDKARRWIEWSLNSQREDGMFGPASNDDWWSRMVMLKALAQYEEATGDRRVIPFMSKYYQHMAKHLDEKPLKDWGQARGGETLLILQWLYERTGDAGLLELGERIHRQTIDWNGIFTEFPYWRRIDEFDHRVHVVNVAMGLKEPALYYALTGDRSYMEAVSRGIASLMTYHGQAHGMFSGDEWLAGTHPGQGSELCAVVEYMFSLENIVRISGEGAYADRLERVAFNALPAAITEDWRGHQYDQQANQVACTLAVRDWTENGPDANLFGLEPHFGCCTANMHQGWPKFAARLWMETEEGGLAAISYAPCVVRKPLPDGREIRLHVVTEYPFREQVYVRVACSGSVRMPLKLRIPGWCESPEIRVNGSVRPVDIGEDRFVSLPNEWRNDDVITLILPMTVKLERRANHAVSVTRGPLVYALPIQERWSRLRGEDPFPDWEVHPLGPWNYALMLEADRPASRFRTEERPVGVQPFSSRSPALLIHVQGRRVPHWKLVRNSADAPPMSPVATAEPEESLALVPYGAAKLRITEFPICN